MRTLKRVLVGALALALVAGLAGAAPSPSLALERSIRQQLFKVAVQLGPLLEVEQDGKTSLRSKGWGSGTIISADGYILTNYHVVDVEDLKYEVPENVTVREGEMAVFATVNVDQPPVPAFIAEVVASEPELDLAVLRVVSTPDGKPVNWKQTKLPYAVLGDSDELLPLDKIYIFGYPGIGGDTITVVEGEVSGFTAQQGVGNRAWIKTNATIAGGNSGGTAVDEGGKLIGVPTRAGSGSETGSYVDCRPLADTNGDGQLDEDDTCVPIGGFINALRSINAAKPLINKAMKGAQPTPAPGKTPTPAKGQPTPRPQATPTPQAKPTPGPGSGVIVTGTIVDADTGRGIPGAVFLALQPGITYDEFESDDQVYTAAEADQDGEFLLPDPLMRGESYTLVAGLRGYYPVYEDDVLVGEDCDPVVELTVRLKKR